MKMLVAIFTYHYIHVKVETQKPLTRQDACLFSSTLKTQDSCRQAVFILTDNDSCHENNNIWSQDFLLLSSKTIKFSFFPNPTSTYN